VPTLPLWDTAYGRIEQAEKVTGLWMLIWSMLYWEWVGGTGEPLFVMNIKLVCVQVLVQEVSRVPNNGPKTLTSVSSPSSFLVKVRSVSCRLAKQYVQCLTAINNHTKLAMRKKMRYFFADEICGTSFSQEWSLC